MYRSDKHAKMIIDTHHSKNENGRVNVSISATTNEDLDLKTMKESEEEIKYIGPHPAEGSGTHRYTMMLFEQTGPIDLKEHSDILDRSGFSLRRFSSQIGLQPAGVMAWISQWHKRDAQAISSIYRDQLRLSYLSCFSKKVFQKKTNGFFECEFL
jgi:hypothetical protein